MWWQEAAQVPKGGFREGAGRPPGSPNKVTAELRRRVMENGLTPLQVMIRRLKEANESGDEEALRFWTLAAAPYLHPKLASTEVKVDADVRQSVVSGEPL